MTWLEFLLCITLIIIAWLSCETIIPKLLIWAWKKGFESDKTKRDKGTES